jgi:heptosyltransferase II
METSTIIIRMPNWVGDLVMATPILADLRKAFPKAAITAMCKSPICELLNNDPAIDELFCFTKPVNSFERREDKRDIISKLQAGKFDLGILLTNSFSSAWWFWQGKVKRRLGYRNGFRNFLLTDAIKRPQTKMHQVDVYKKLLEPLGIFPSNTAPRLFVDEKEVADSKELLFQRGYKTGKPLIGINPGAAYGSAKCWPVDRFRSLCLELLKDDVYVVLFGDGSSDALVKEICLGLPSRVMNLAGLTSLRELACLIKDCTVFVTNDSGPMHIAAAFGVPLVALFGSTDEIVTGPYGQSQSVINKHVSCSPCLKRKCPIDFRCMTQISVAEVALSIRKKLGFHV